jgi:hypothetical protein
MSSISYLRSKVSRSNVIQCWRCCLKCFYSVLLFLYMALFMQDIIFKSTGSVSSMTQILQKYCKQTFFVQLNTFYMHLWEGLAGSIFTVFSVRFVIGNVKYTLIIFACTDASVLGNFQRCDQTGAHPEFFLGGGGAGGPEPKYNLCLILQVMLQKSRCKYNIMLSVTACIYIGI